MNRILNKRIFRDLKKNLVRYAALFVLIVMGIFVITSMFGSADTIITRAKEYSRELRVEDGQFTTFMPLTADEKKEISSRDITFEENFFLDFTVGGDTTLRVFKNRKDINLVKLDEGSAAADKNQVVLEKLYAKKNSYKLGDSIKIGNENYKIVGIGTSPDYESPLANVYDTGTNSKLFGTAFVSEDGYEALKNSGLSKKTEEYLYSYTLGKSMDSDELKEYLKKNKVSPYGKEAIGTPLENVRIDNLTAFIKSDENARIGACSDNVAIKKKISQMAGVIVIILIAYIISVFITHSIEMESTIIGALYSLGTKKSTLLMHYIILPVVICLAGGLLGTVLSFTPVGIEKQMLSQASYYSIANMDIIFSPMVIVYGCVLPPVIAAIVNIIVIFKKLNVPALKLLRNERKVFSARKGIKLNNANFLSKFRVRQFLREIKIYVIVFAGIFISMLLLMESLTGFSFLNNMIDQNNRDIKYEYMYTCKIPDREVPAGGEEGFEKPFKKEIYGYNLTVNVMGIKKGNPYFDFDVKKGENQIAISSSVANKYGLKTGDDFVIKDELENKEYTLKISDVVQYSVALYAFMDIDSMRELLGKDKDYYNVVLSDKELDIDSSKLLAVTTRADIKETADIFMEKNMGMFVMVGAGATAMFFIVMYLMLKMMLDRSSFNISLAKVFGYKNKEIRKLYLDANLFTIIVSSAISIPLAKMIMGRMFPSMLANLAAGADVSFKPPLYILVVLIVVISYIIVNSLLIGRINRISHVQALKTRE
ncbi:putative ABC transport system permease protein [Ruminiclostridium sufflavum DSM 19573]|uniref:Putative ABC transport system permease protein n=1 Tax=Ruminiclostridium sufflavum DSM 19573 TaxID=1121337 RepID=A0A318XMT6_9FIRM|nr:FtsX-like permease family protein [Ruminiclostridium sufflavum]PYG89172.1 putative ABC transport system permease protein [Ruminiclostridium sufflavum DSM 19573]